MTQIIIPPIRDGRETLVPATCRITLVGAIRALLATDLARVANCSTVQSTGAQLAAALSDIAG